MGHMMCHTGMIGMLFTKDEQEHLAAFLKDEPRPGYLYTNEAGEVREVLRVDYPSGLYIKGVSQEGAFIDKASPFRWYHTPRATLENTKLGEIVYKAGDDVTTCSSADWLAWKPVKSEVKPDDYVPTKVPVQMLINQKEARELAKAEAAQEKKEGAEWRSTTKRGKRSVSGF